MAFRIEKAVVRGEISNDERGLVTGRVWLSGRKEPLVLRLQGNCMRDLAGCRLRFANPSPESDPSLSVLTSRQHGVTGELTASRKVRQPMVPDQEVMSLIEKRQEIPCRLANCLYLEWYSETNGRVLLEATDYQLEVSERQWAMEPEDEEEELLRSQQRFQEYIDTITGEGSPGAEDDEAILAVDPITDLEPADGESEDHGPGDSAPGEPLNEFEWEEELRDADRRAEAYQEAFEKYRDHPERERLIAEALGWEASTDEPEETVEDVEPPVEWIEDDQESERHHPLSQQAMDFALTLQREAEERGLMGDNPELRESPVLALILHIISLGGKLAGALDGWAQGLDPEPGFIIAMLKRAQVPLNEALHAFDCIETSSLTEETKTWLQARKRDLFDLRREILDLMQQLRTT
jgi:hypothetical protein